MKTITGDKSFLHPLVDKKATFMLAMSNTKTAKIKGISQAGLPGLLHLTPTLDAEFLSRGKLKSLKKLPKTKNGIPTPALISRAIHLLYPYGHIEAMDLGLKIPPKLKCPQYRFDIKPSGSIDKGANIEARTLFEKGMAFGRSYQCKEHYLILGESVPSGTTTAAASALALGYHARSLFSSSFKNVPKNIKKRTIDKALSKIKEKTDPFDILSSVGDNMLIFIAGFILGVNSRFPLILAGGTQMAAVLLVADTLAKHLDIKIDSSQLALCTTKWVAEDPNSDIDALLHMLDFPINAYYADFTFSLSHHPLLKLYDKGEAKEGVGAGGALVYGMLNGLTPAEITRQVEGLLP
ncbi:nicotinate-nucleotide--dimethylbenzimidazole phosphoribosyltransferase [Sulfurovum lithotrophicum]|uniref:Nicotinate-nucleotide--dimethylbenzimidazole phosphoribosyltransferase n=1 Tax=Sulfurovum lithotrophicum TaxID=206403 RepID=A0A7U4M347_9BACT|nr:nicotinate-nucleotide--dimethylbenzimidazole phosphoribosyltransferase [Sulfurovum lithotrophicum]